jgi:hypothetical protein
MAKFLGSSIAEKRLELLVSPLQFGSGSLHIEESAQADGRSPSVRTGTPVQGLDVASVSADELPAANPSNPPVQVPEGVRVDLGILRGKEHPGEWNSGEPEADPAHPLVQIPEGVAVDLKVLPAETGDSPGAADPEEWQKTARNKLQGAVSRFGITRTKASILTGYGEVAPIIVKRALHSIVTSEYAEKITATPNVALCIAVLPQKAVLYPKTQGDAEDWSALADAIEALCKTMEERTEVVQTLQCELRIYDDRIKKLKELRPLLVKYGVPCPMPCICPSVEQAKERFFESLRNSGNLEVADPGNWYDGVEPLELRAILQEVQRANETNDQAIQGIYRREMEIRALEARRKATRDLCTTLRGLHVFLGELLGGEVPGNDFPDLASFDVAPGTVGHLETQVAEGEKLPDHCKAAITPFIVPLAQLMRELPTVEELRRQLPEPPADGAEDRFATMRAQLDFLRSMLNCAQLPLDRRAQLPLSEVVLTEIRSDEDVRRFVAHERCWFRIQSAVKYIEGAHKLQEDIAALRSAGTA